MTCCEIDLTLGPMTPIELNLTVSPIELIVAPQPIELTLGLLAPIELAVSLNPIVLEFTGVGMQGPPGPAGAGGAIFDTTNKQGSTIQAGQVATGHPTGVGIVLANATDDTKPAIGLVTTIAADQAACQVQTDGPFTLADWTAVTGSASLAARAVYYLDIVSGMLTLTPPTVNPAIVHRIGRAVSPQSLSIDIWGFVKL